MKNVRLNYLVVGCFMIAVVVALVFTVGVPTGRTGATDDYYALRGNVTGVEFGTRVLYEGYPIGQVERIVPEDRDGKIRFRVEMSVARGWKIAKDSMAEIAASGLLSAVTINVRAGEAREHLQPGAEIASRESASIMAAMGDLARDVRALTDSDIKPMIARLNAIVGGIGDMIGAEDGAGANDVKTMIQTITKAAPDVVDNLSAFASRLNESSGQLERLLSEKNVKTFDRMLENLSLSSDNMNRFTAQLGETQKSIDALIGNIERMVGDMKTMVGDNKLDVERAIVDMRHAVETVARHIDVINENLESASRNMVEFSRAIRQNPGLLLGGTPPADNARPN